MGVGEVGVVEWNEVEVEVEFEVELETLSLRFEDGYLGLGLEGRGKVLRSSSFLLFSIFLPFISFYFINYCFFYYDKFGMSMMKNWIFLAVFLFFAF